MALTKAVIVRVDRPEMAPIPVMFNPPHYDLSKTNQFAEISVPGLATAVLQFVSGNATNLSMELFFDTTEAGEDVRRLTAPIVTLTEPDPFSKAPPQLLLLWGSLAFPCVLVGIQQRFDYFNASGLPLRATLRAEFKGHESAGAAPFAGVAPFEQATRYVAALGETLQAVAAQVYGDARRWRDIARANSIDDPRAIDAGRVFQIPRLP